MKRLGPIALALLAACNQPAPEKTGPVTRIEIGKGAVKPKATASVKPAVSSACEAVSFEGVPLTHCVADPARHRITTALANEGGPPYRSFAELGRAVKAKTIAFAVNGGMFGEDGKPIGYYVEESNRLKQLNRADGGGNFHLKPNGVFFGTGAKWQVMPSEAFNSKVGDRPAFGTQSGPMLVIDGKLHPEFAEEGPSKLIRNGVGVDAAGRAHFVISEAPVSFGRFARYFRDGLKTPNALYLDGSVSSLWDPASSRQDARAPLGPLIVVETVAKAVP
ncbi:MAG: phosphodiester glycosidase family protein [Novosphingobium sp.]|nr:phosphodiester glycosidase family protein [Novosphingobium sp.]